MLYLTGDTHGEMSMNRLSNKNFPDGAKLTRDDYVIVAGDFGLIFYPDPTPAEMWWLKWLKERPFNVALVDGNHENHDRLAELPRKTLLGGTVGVIAENIFHLRRGEIYEIEGKKILTFGGAMSIDKENRMEHVSWWANEVPSYADMDNCLANLEKHNYKVDYIIAHTCPNTLAKMLTGSTKLFYDDPTGKMLEHIVSVCEFQDYYCGHWHVDKDLGKYHFLYNRIVRV